MHYFVFIQCLGCAPCAGPCHTASSATPPPPPPGSPISIPDRYYRYRSGHDATSSCPARACSARPGTCCHQQHCTIISILALNLRKEAIGFILLAGRTPARGSPPLLSEADGFLRFNVVTGHAQREPRSARPRAAKGRYVARSRRSALSAGHERAAPARARALKHNNEGLRSAAWPAYTRRFIPAAPRLCCRPHRWRSTRPPASLTRRRASRAATRGRCTRALPPPS